MRATKFSMRATAVFITSVVVFASMVVIAHSLQLQSDIAPFRPSSDLEPPPDAASDPAWPQTTADRSGNVGDPKTRDEPQTVVTASPVPRDDAALAESGDTVTPDSAITATVRRGASTARAPSGGTRSSAPTSSSGSQSTGSQSTPTTTTAPTTTTGGEGAKPDKPDKPQPSGPQKDPGAPSEPAPEPSPTPSEEQPTESADGSATGALDDSSEVPVSP
jgi:hypothetical protein